MDLKEERLLGDNIASHWYYVSKGKVLQKLLRGIQADVMVDVGAGSGIFSRLLLASKICKHAICIDTNYESEKTETFSYGQIHYARQINIAECDLILMMDVLEHVDDDAALLHQFVKQLRYGGLIVITVPAFQFLWSGHDDFLEHRRRYTLRDLEHLVNKEGLEIINGRYFYGLLFPIVAVIRLCNRLALRVRNQQASSALKTYPMFLNAILIRLHDIERYLIMPINRAFGLTVVCLARKRQ